MKAVSNGARQAAQNEKNRRYTRSDLASLTGATVGSTYLVSTDKHEQDFVMVVTRVGHYKDDLKFENEDVWRCPAGADKDEFLERTFVEAEFYNIKSSIDGISVTIEDEPFETPRIPRAALRKFHRKSLDAVSMANTFAFPE